jgi:hypothetical protein
VARNLFYFLTGELKCWRILPFKRLVAVAQYVHCDVNFLQKCSLPCWVKGFLWAQYRTSKPASGGLLHELRRGVTFLKRGAILGVIRARCEIVDFCTNRNVGFGSKPVPLSEF